MKLSSFLFAAGMVVMVAGPALADDPMAGMTGQAQSTATQALTTKAQSMGMPSTSAQPAAAPADAAAPTAKDRAKDAATNAATIKLKGMMGN